MSGGASRELVRGILRTAVTTFCSSIIMFAVSEVLDVGKSNESF
jgi:hypothetical protein